MAYIHHVICLSKIGALYHGRAAFELLDRTSGLVPMFPMFLNGFCRVRFAG